MRHPSPMRRGHGTGWEALPEGRLVCVQLAPLPRAGSSPLTSYSGGGGTRPNRARGSGLAWSMWLWGSRKGPTPSIVARQVTQGPASPETAAWTAAGANGLCLWDGTGARAQFQPMQNDSAWLNKPFCVFRSPCFLRGTGLQAGGPVTPHHVLACPSSPHCSQSTATRVRVKWGKTCHREAPSGPELLATPQGRPGLPEQRSEPRGTRSGTRSGPSRPPGRGLCIVGRR